MQNRINISKSDIFLALNDIIFKFNNNYNIDSLSKAIKEFSPRDENWFYSAAIKISDKFLNQINKTIQKAKIVLKI